MWRTDIPSSRTDSTKWDKEPLSEAPISNREEARRSDNEVLQIVGSVAKRISDGVKNRDLPNTVKAITTDWYFALPTIESCRVEDWREPLEAALKKRGLQPLHEKILREALSKALQNMGSEKASASPMESSVRQAARKKTSTTLVHANTNGSITNLNAAKKAGIPLK